MFKILILGKTEENATKQLNNYLNKYTPFEWDIKTRHKFNPNTVLLSNDTLIQAVGLSESPRSLLGDFIMVDSSINFNDCFIQDPTYFARNSPLPFEFRVMFYDIK
jgi:hypothetical protein